MLSYICVWFEESVMVCFLRWMSNCSHNSFWKGSPLSCCFADFAGNETSVHMWVYFQDFFLFHWCMSVSMLAPYCFDYSSSVVSFKIQKRKSSMFLSFFPRLFLATESPLRFHMNFRVSFSFISANILAFWKGLHWIYKLLWVVLTS